MNRIGNDVTESLGRDLRQLDVLSSIARNVKAKLALRHHLPIRADVYERHMLKLRRTAQHQFHHRRRQRRRPKSTNRKRQPTVMRPPPRQEKEITPRPGHQPIADEQHHRQRHQRCPAPRQFHPGQHRAREIHPVLRRVGVEIGRFGHQRDQRLIVPIHRAIPDRLPARDSFRAFGDNLRIAEIVAHPHHIAQSIGPSSQIRRRFVRLTIKIDERALLRRRLHHRHFLGIQIRPGIANLPIAAPVFASPRRLEILNFHLLRIVEIRHPRQHAQRSRPLFVHHAFQRHRQKRRQLALFELLPILPLAHHQLTPVAHIILDRRQRLGPQLGRIAPRPHNRIDGVKTLHIPGQLSRRDLVKLHILVHRHRVIVHIQQRLTVRSPDDQHQPRPQPLAIKSRFVIQTVRRRRPRHEWNLQKLLSILLAQENSNQIGELGRVCSNLQIPRLGHEINPYVLFDPSPVPRIAIERERPRVKHAIAVQIFLHDGNFVSPRISDPGPQTQHHRHPAIGTISPAEADAFHFPFSLSLSESSAGK